MRVPASGVFALSLSLMATEILLTRIFSVVLWYHFAFFAISVALFGAGAAALALHLVQGRLTDERAPAVLTATAALFAVTTVVVDVFLVRVGPLWFGSMFGEEYLSAMGRLGALFAMAASPFFVGGFAISLAVTRSGSRVHALYAADLFGAGAGCLVSVPLLGSLGGPSALVAAGALGVVAAAVFANGFRGQLPRGSTRAWLAGAGLVVTAAAVAARGGLLDVPAAKALDRRVMRSELDRWNSFSHVTVVPGVGFRGWGTSPRYQGEAPEQKALYIDMAAVTVLTRFDGTPRSAEWALHDLSAFVFRARPGAREVCVLGAGAGKDVLSALASGASRVTAVEINPLIVNDVVRGKFAEFTGGLYDRPDVDVHVEDGRSFVRRTDRTFDILLLSMVDTSAATAAGAFTLTENSLYTREAFGDFLGRLAPGGVLSVSTVSFPGLAVGARLVAMARDAIERRGGDAAASIAVLRTPWLGGAGVMHDVLVKPSGFDAEDRARIAAQADALGFGVEYLAGVAPPAGDVEAAWIFDVATATDRAALAARMRAWPVDTSPATDDRPFFFYQDRLRYFLPALLSVSAGHPFGNGLVVLSKVLAVSLLVVLAFLIVPTLAGRRELRGGGGRAAWDVLLAASVGVGFMFVELGVLQRFSPYLGQPTYTLAVVLLVLLVGGGVGSRLVSAVPVPARRSRLLVALAVLVAYVVALRASCPPLFAATLGWSGAGRAAVSAAVLAPLGVLLGMPFPTALSAVAARAPTRLPWLWAVNSATSVLGSVVATVVSLHGGIDATLGLGAATYALTLVVAARVVGGSGSASGSGGFPR